MEDVEGGSDGGIDDDDSDGAVEDGGVIDGGLDDGVRDGTDEKDEKVKAVDVEVNDGLKTVAIDH